MDTSELRRIFPLAQSTDPLYEDEHGVWQLHLLHDVDGYGVGFAFRWQSADGETHALRAIFSDEEAEDLGGAFIAAAMYARARNAMRAESN